MMTSIGCGAKTVPTPESKKQNSTVVTEKSPTAPSVDSKATEADHAHKPGSHGGIIVPIGTDSYHAEAVIEKGGTIRLLTLGKDESRIQEVDEQAIKAYVKIVGQSDTTPVELAATPQEGDTPGQTSQFVGVLPDELRGQPLEVTIPNLRIKGERFRIGFTTQTASHQEEMPAGLPAAEEQALYLTPAGKYTEADIEANGNVTASQKFKGVMSSHDMKPKPGDRICPVTLTKANSKFTWVIDGKPYQFCCPPCVDEFVKTAKQQPDEVKLPETYIK
ncbi:MAG: hypothetical protein JWP89_414 [Schlesneria sp.]|nr:hypothetical protein [Schlesneria sp.]